MPAEKGAASLGLKVLFGSTHCSGHVDSLFIRTGLDNVRPDAGQDCPNAEFHTTLCQFVQGHRMSHDHIMQGWPDNGCEKPYSISEWSGNS